MGAGVWLILFARSRDVFSLWMLNLPYQSLSSFSCLLLHTTTFAACSAADLLPSQKVEELWLVRHQQLRRSTISQSHSYHIQLSGILSLPKPSNRPRLRSSACADRVPFACQCASSVLGCRPVTEALDICRFSRFSCPCMLFVDMVSISSVFKCLCHLVARAFLAYPPVTCETPDQAKFSWELELRLGLFQTVFFTGVTLSEPTDSYC